MSNLQGSQREIQVPSLPIFGTIQKEMLIDILVPGLLNTHSNMPSL